MSKILLTHIGNKETVTCKSKRGRRTHQRNAGVLCIKLMNKLNKIMKLMEISEKIC